MNLELREAVEILDKIKYKEGWRFWIGASKSIDNSDLDWYIQLECPVDDVMTGEHRSAKGRMWQIPFKTEADLVKTAFFACLQMEEHECREAFTYDGAALFNPHLPMRDLVEVARNYSEAKALAV